MEKIDYLKIVIEGYQVYDNRKFLKNHFIRHWKNAESNHYSIEEYFTGLLNVVKAMDNDINYRNAKRVNELSMIISKWKSDPDLSDEKKESLKECEDELERIKEGGVFSYAYLPGISLNRYFGNLSPDEVDYIRYNIVSAYKEVAPKKEDAPEEKPKKIKKDKTFEEYFIIKPSDIEGLKEFMQNNGGKNLSGIIYQLQESGYLPEKINLTGLLRSFTLEYPSAVNKYLVKDENNLCEFDYDKRDLKITENQLIKYL